MAKLFLIIAIIGIVSFFLQQFLEALFITTLIVFTVFLFVGLVFTFQGLTTSDISQLVGGLAISVFSASYILASYLYVKRNKERTKG